MNEINKSKYQIHIETIRNALAALEKDMVFLPLGGNPYPDGAEQQELFGRKRMRRTGKVKIIFENGWSCEEKTLKDAVMFLTGKPESTAQGLSFDRALEYVNKYHKPMFHDIKELQVIKKNGTTISTADVAGA